MYGERSSYQIQRNYYRYHLVIPMIPWKDLPMQDMVSCDNNRTPVQFQGSDNLVFVGVINGNSVGVLSVISKSNRRF